MEISFLYYQLGRDAVPSHTILSRQYDNCLIFDFIAEYFLFMKDMKMDKKKLKENTRNKKEIQKLSLNARTPSRNSVRAIEI